MKTNGASRGNVCRFPRQSLPAQGRNRRQTPINALANRQRRAYIGEDTGADTLACCEVNMTYNGARWISRFLETLIFALFLASLTDLAISKEPPPTVPTLVEMSAVKLEILDAKVEVLDRVNEKLLQTVYWTLATLAAIFLGLISVNLYFNISANKREIEKIKEEVSANAAANIKSSEASTIEKLNGIIQREIEKSKEEISSSTTGNIKSSEGSVIERMSITMQREIEKSSANTVLSAKNEILSLRAALLKLHEGSGKKIEVLGASVKDLQEKIEDLNFKILELEVHRHSQKGQLGAIIKLIALLEHDLSHRRWNLKSRLGEIDEEIKGCKLYEEHAAKLKLLLGGVTEPDLKALAKKIVEKIVLRAAD
jgi:hypothetical protein